jgi:hypothetical protein
MVFDFENPCAVHNSTDQLSSVQAVKQRSEGEKNLYYKLHIKN